MLYLTSLYLAACGRKHHDMADYRDYDIIIKQLDSRESRLCAYFEKIHEKRAA